MSFFDEILFYFAESKSRTNCLTTAFTLIVLWDLFFFPNLFLLHFNTIQKSIFDEEQFCSFSGTKDNLNSDLSWLMIVKNPFLTTRLFAKKLWKSILRIHVFIFFPGFLKWQRKISVIGASEAWLMMPTCLPFKTLLSLRQHTHTSFSSHKLLSVSSKKYYNFWMFLFLRI